MSEIIRTKTRASGWITTQEKKKLDKHSKLWIDRIMRTKKIDPKKIIPAIKGLYKVSWLKEPKVIIVPSPLVMRLAWWLSAAILYLRDKGAATYAATIGGTYGAKRVNASAATNAATGAATNAAASEATKAATRAAT